LTGDRRRGIIAAVRLQSLPRRLGLPHEPWHIFCYVFPVSSDRTLHFFPEWSIRMDTYTIDVELEHYVGDRLATNNRDACRRLYLRSVARFNGPELAVYLDRVRAHANVYASVSRMLQSPFRHMESPLFLSSLILFLAGVVMMTAGQFSTLVAGGTSAGIVGMIHAARRFFSLWLQHGIREAVFRELAETLQDEAGMGMRP
jgi:hypothetical protein